MATNVDFNGKTKWILWLAGIVFFLLTTWLSGLTTNVIANDKASRERDSSVKECMHVLQNEIVQRLVRIETKLEK